MKLLFSTLLLMLGFCGIVTSIGLNILAALVSIGGLK
jgi:hypothetical protein